MKSLRFLRFLLFNFLVVSASAQQSAWITNYLTDGNGNPVACTVKARLLSEIYSSTNRLVIKVPMTWTVGTDGVLYTNIMAGLYELKFGDFYGTINILVPDTTNTYDLGTISTNIATFNVTNYVPLISGALLVGDAPSLTLDGFGLASTNWVRTNSAAVTSALGYSPPTNHWAWSLGLLTNNGLIWCSTNLAANTAPNAVLPDGSILTGTNGALWLRTNATWVLK